MSWVQIFPVGDADTTEFERFITKNSSGVPRVTQIEQASFNFRVGYALFENSDKAEKVSNELNKSQFKGKKVHAVQIEPVEDEYGILVGPKGFVQEGNYDSERGSRYYPGHQSSLVSGSSKRHTNRRSYQQQQTDPRNFGSIASKYDDEDQPEVQQNIPYQQNPRYPPSAFNRPQQFPEQGYDQRNMSFGNDQEEKISSRDSKSKSRHRKHRRDSSDSSSSSTSSDSSYSSPKQSRHKHRHHHHHHRKSK